MTTSAPREETEEFGLHELERTRIQEVLAREKERLFKSAWGMMQWRNSQVFRFETPKRVVSLSLETPKRQNLSHLIPPQAWWSSSKWKASSRSVPCWQCFSEKPRNARHSKSTQFAHLWQDCSKSAFKPFIHKNRQRTETSDFFKKPYFHHHI